MLLDDVESLVPKNTLLVVLLQGSTGPRGKIRNFAEWWLVLSSYGYLFASYSADKERVDEERERGGFTSWENGPVSGWVRQGGERGDADARRRGALGPASRFRRARLAVQAGLLVAEATSGELAGAWARVHGSCPAGLG